MEPDFDSAVRRIRAGDNRFSPVAYKLVRDGLAHTAKKLGKLHAEGAARHMDGAQLALGIRDFATERYGCAAAHLLISAGIRKSDDIGAIVFQLIEAGIFGKSETDHPDDFRGIFDFHESFVEPYRPAIRLRRQHRSCIENA